MRKVFVILVVLVVSVAAAMAFMLRRSSDRPWVFTLGLHRESTYSELSAEDAEEKRRIFWLLFVTER